jgi:hypothetical protein
MEERGIIQNTIFMFIFCYQQKLNQALNITKDTELYYPFGKIYLYLFIEILETSSFKLTKIPTAYTIRSAALVKSIVMPPLPANFWEDVITLFLAPEDRKKFPFILDLSLSKI